jgi:hypothetical protein
LLSNHHITISFVYRNWSEKEGSCPRPDRSFGVLCLLSP